MNPKELEALRNYYDNNDTTKELELAELDTTVDSNPMIGITVRLPANVLNAARARAAGENRKVTALLREWIEQATVGPVGPNVNNVVHGDFSRQRRRSRTFSSRTAGM
ncbi:hypothetical protein [Antrihabitans spumae]|uniref:Uncharacterized protein n=1 Tax=Antrihabitans spumae TaxID=3373370 RepID=A0ABW7KEL1_9NOCA